MFLSLSALWLWTDPFFPSLLFSFLPLHSLPPRHRFTSLYLRTAPHPTSQLKNHTHALTLLAHTARDHKSAETYCLTRGAVVTPRAARAVVEKNGLGEVWGGFVGGWEGAEGGGKGGSRKGGTGRGRGGKSKGGRGGKGGGEEKKGGEEDEETTRLLRVLLGVYVGSGDEGYVFSVMLVVQ